MCNVSLAVRTDSYKVTHWPVMPEGTEELYSYIESRGGMFSETVVFGIHYYLKKYLSKPITEQDVLDARDLYEAHFGTASVFNFDGFMHIVKDHGGFFPLKIKFAPEGLVVPTRNVLGTIVNTCPKCAWCTNWVETLILKVWYPITVATLSREIKKVINRYLEKTGTPSLLPFKLHDFGYRGVSSEESAELGGMAHLTSFMGTDTVLALVAAQIYYNAKMAGFSIPATEHMVMTALGPEGEFRQIERHIDTFADGPFPAIACVMDQFDIFKAIKDGLGGELRAKIIGLEAKNKCFVVRPDSGIPHVIVVQVLETLGKEFGFERNEKGYKVLPKYLRVIQGDGINYEEIGRILEAMEAREWSADNIAFGMGGALLQQVNRDTQKFAFKASSITINGRVRDVYKDPKTDSGKRSKRGKLKLMYVDGVLETVSADTPGEDVLQTVYENGKILIEPTFDEIRERAALKTVAPALL